MSKSNRGFASFDKDKLKAAASSGGKRVQALGKAHKFSHEQAVAAGKKGKRKPIHA